MVSVNIFIKKYFMVSISVLCLELFLFGGTIFLGGRNYLQGEICENSSVMNITVYFLDI